MSAAAISAAGIDGILWFPRPGASRDQAKPGKPHKSRFTILDVDDMDEMPESAWLIEGLIPLDSLVELFGPSDSYKSFFAIAVACCVATGTDCLGHAVKGAGNVVYVYAEGGRGIPKRRRAWERHNNNGAKARRFHGIAEPVNMIEDDHPKALIEDIRAKSLHPRLIVLDTKARCFGDGDENSTRDMNKFVTGCDRLRRAFPDCTILVVHHTGYNEARSRGASSGRAAVDTELRWERHEKTPFCSLSVTKQKDFPEPRGAIDIELFDVDGPGTNSGTLRLANPAAVKAVKTSNDTIALATLRASGANGLTNAEWAANSGIKPNTLRGVRDRLRERGLVKTTAKRWYAVPEEEANAAREELSRSLGLSPRPTAVAA